MIPWLLSDPDWFPAPPTALTEPNGLLAVGGDLAPPRLLAAYRRGIFPWYSRTDPILWWSPDPRLVLFPAELKISRSLAKTLRNKAYSIRLDTAFATVIRACAETPRNGRPGTWITTEMQAAYGEMHRLGYVHSVETWIDGQLAGGLYGMALGRVFYGESMFSLQPDASKIALAHLCVYLEQLGFGIIDCQMETSHLTSLGARPISRDAFVAAVDRFATAKSTPGPWPAAAVDGSFRSRK